MTKKQKSKKRLRMSDFRLRVMADYESSGIWVIGKIGVFRHGMIEHSSLKLPSDLAMRFNEWIASYLGRLDYPEFAHIGFDIDRFNQEGRELAHALKEHMGPECYVEFVPEADTGLGEVEAIGLTTTSTGEAQL